MRERCGVATGFQPYIGRKGEGMYIITAIYRGGKITRTAFGDFQAFTIINQLAREGCVDIGMREEE